MDMSCVGRERTFSRLKKMESAEWGASSEINAKLIKLRDASESCRISQADQSMLGRLKSPINNTFSEQPAQAIAS
ncbi:hypothetical protein J6590_102873 [Homalodisca vitripennis]|nr:hypothetical protein J6590_102873 [Homalodisca vitripennis]